MSQYSGILAPLAVESVLQIVDDEKTAKNVDLGNIREATRFGDTEDTQPINGLVFEQEASKGAGGPTRIENPRIALIQCQISPPKTLSD